jgi:hypothetical protein
MYDSHKLNYNKVLVVLDLHVKILYNLSNEHVG